MCNILQLFIAISNDPHSMLLTGVHYRSQKRLIFVTLNSRCAVYVSGQIKHLNMETKVHHKNISALRLPSSVCHGYDWNECLSHRHNIVDMLYTR